jgi:hypothetical protein
MATPLTPHLHGEDALAWLMQRYPNHTREELIRLADDYGFALMGPSPADAGQEKSAAEIPRRPGNSA